MNRKNIADAALARIDSDADYAERHGVIRFGCDHSHLLITANRKGVITKDLLYDGRGQISNGVAAHLLQHCSPATMRELVRAYRFAKENGLPEINTITGKPADDKS